MRSLGFGRVRTHILLSLYPPSRPFPIVFSKCKESLQDGRRLENISWRLWHREMAASQSYRPLTPESVSPAPSEGSRNLSPFFPHYEHDNMSKSCDLSHPMHSHCSTIIPLQLAAEQPSPVHSSHRSSPVASFTLDPPTVSSGLTLSFAHANSHPSVGKVICYILPRLIRLPVDKPMATTTPCQVFLPTPTAETFHRNHETSLPTPSADAEILTSRMLEHPHAIPSVQLPSTPPEPASTFPRVVVVNPTPNLTPHPTPPTSPVFPSNIPTPVQPHSSRLFPPLPPPALTLTAKVPDECVPNLSPSSIPHTSRSQQHPGSPPSPPPPQPKSIDEALKPSDRRFFLQSPDGESPERSEGQKSVSDQASSATSSGLMQGSADVINALAGAAAITNTTATRKGKEPARHAPARHIRVHAARPTVIRRSATIDGCKVRATVNIGSTSSNGSGPKRDGSRDGSKRSAVPAVSKSVSKAPHTTKTLPAAKPVVVASPPKPANLPQRRRIVVASTSSEYETTDTEDGDGDSWASEDPSVEDAEKTKEEVKLREAAMEAQRQREMFAKVPKRSYSNLNRTKSGLLSQLLNPDPTIFPSNHPYRTSFSTQDFSQLPRASVYAPRGLHTSKSAMALPLAAQITAQVPSAGQCSSRAAPSSGSGGYRPKGRPQGQEMEEDSDSAEENPDDSIQVSRSVAQQKLAALAGRRNTSRETPQRRPSPPPPVRPPLIASATSPVPLRHPYNLPAPAPPSTPRTTRRQMLQTELSESLRRNLLWERQVSKVNVRRHSGGINGLRPLTSTTSVVQVSAKRDPGSKRDLSSKSGNEREQDGREQRKLARNRSWADDYHYSGW
jgi:hypothetical protein